MQTNQNQKILRLTESGILLAIGILIDTFLKFDATWLYGGSVTLCSMLPLVVIAYKYGPAWGSLAGVVHGLITMLISGGRAGGLAAMIESNGGLTTFFWVMLLDYILAFAAIGLAGFAPKFVKKVPAALAGTSAIFSPDSSCFPATRNGSSEIRCPGAGGFWKPSTGTPCPRCIP